MALMKWDDEEERKRQEEMQGASPIKTIASVQSGSWQPAPSGANAPAMDGDEPKINNGIFDQPTAQPQRMQNNYLMSEQKAQVDAQKRQRDIEIENARRAQAAAQAQAAQAQAYNRAQTQAQPQNQPLDMNKVKQDTGWKKYYKDAFKREKAGMNFFDRLLDGGSASRRAEVMARNKYNAAMNRQAYNDAGQTVDPKAAMRARELTAYNSNIAANNSERAMADARAIGATYDNKSSGFLDRVKDTVNAERQMSIGSALLGVNDTQKKNAGDLGRVGLDLLQGFATGPALGTKATLEALTGSGTNYDTGVQEKLDGGQRVGRGVAGAVDLIGTFYGGSSNLTKSMQGALTRKIGSKVASGVASEAEEALFKQLIKRAATQAGETGVKGFIKSSLGEGVENAIQGGAEYFGNDGSLVDENGQIDPDEITQLAKETAAAGAMGVAGGAVFNVAGKGFDRIGGRDTPIVEGGIEPVREGNIGEQPIAEGVANPNELTPVIGGETPNESLDLVTPVDAPAVADGSITNTPADVTPVRDAPVETQPSPIDEFSPVDTPVVDAPIQSDVTPIRSDGVSDMTPVRNVPEVDSTPIQSDEVRSLQESRAGKNQAQEAEINQQLQEIENTAPKVSTKGLNQLDQLEPVQPAVQGKRDLSRSSANDNTSIFTPIKNKLKDFNNKLGEGGYAKIPEKGDLTPVKTDSLPDGMSSTKDTPTNNSVPEGVVTKDNPLTKQQTADRLISNVNHVEDAKSQLANGLGIPLDSKLEVSDMLTATGVDGKSAKIIEDSFNALKKNDAVYNKIQEVNKKDYVAGKGANKKLDRKRNAALRDSLDSLSTVMKEIRYLKRQGSASERAVQALEGVVKYRTVNVLTSIGLFERNAAQEIVSTAFRTSQNPIKTVTGMVGYGNPLSSAVKSTYRDTKNVPHGITSKARHASTSVYKAGMTITDALQQTRAGMYRDEIARQALKLGGNKNPSISEIRQLSKRHGALGEAVAQMYVGADSQIIPRKSALKAGDALMQFLRTGSDGDLKAVNKAIESTSTVSDGIIKQLEATGKMNNKVGRALASVINGTFMFTRVATNAARNSVEMFNPFTPSLVDSIGRTNRGKLGNLALSLKSKPAAYAVLGAIPAMYAAGNVGYNDGEDPDKPRGVWIKTPSGKYIDSRSTGLFELPIGIMVLGSELYKDAQDDNMRDASYYSGIITQSLPYVDTADQASGAITSLVDVFFGGNTETSDGGYKAGSYAVNQAKSLVPFSNNSIQPYVEGKKGNSVNLKSTYANKEVPDGKGGTKKVPDMMQWFKNSMYKSYPGLFPDEYGKLKDSRDAAGRSRTVDNQGVLINKTINDKSTAEFNDTLTDLVKFGRKEGYGKNVQEMFNTYPDGKNNNFKSAQDVITFLDVKDGDKPENKDKLKKNDKLADLAQQQRNGFYGDTGSELLTLDGQNLWSDVSMPNSNKTKNSNKPLSMESIRNAIAATDLPDKDRDAMNAVWEQGQAKYKQVESGSMSYGQYKEQMAKLEKDVYLPILNKSANYKKMKGLFDKLDGSGFFEKDGLGSTKSGQTYLWNSLNALLGDKGKTPAADYPKDDNGFTPWGKRGGGGRKGSGFSATNKPGDRGNTGVKWTPVQRRQMAATASGKYTPVKIKVKLGNEIKKDKTQNYSDRSF